MSGALWANVVASCEQRATTELHKCELRPLRTAGWPWASRSCDKKYKHAMSKRHRFIPHPKRQVAVPANMTCEQ